MYCYILAVSTIFAGICGCRRSSLEKCMLHFWVVAVAWKNVLLHFWRSRLILLEFVAMVAVLNVLQQELPPPLPCCRCRVHAAAKLPPPLPSCPPRLPSCPPRLPSCSPWPSCRCGRAAAKLLLPPPSCCCRCQAAAAALLPLPLPLPPPWPRCR
jgi:hypothetical protein